MEKHNPFVETIHMQRVLEISLTDTFKDLYCDFLGNDTREQVVEAIYLYDKDVDIRIDEDSRAIVLSKNGEDIVFKIKQVKG